MRWPLSIMRRPGPVALLAGGTALAQAVGLMASPALTRVFGPEAFGALAAFTALLGFFSVLGGGRYEMAVLLPADAREGWALLRLAVGLATALSLLLLALALLLDLTPWPPAGRALTPAPAAQGLAERWGWPGLMQWRWLLPPAVLLSVALAALGAWFNRTQRYGVLAASRVGQALVVAATSLALAAIGQESLGLVWGVLAGLACGVAWQGLVLARGPWPPAGAAQAVPASMRELARRHAEFPRVNLPHALLDQAQTMLLVALVSAGWGAAALGLHALALRVVRAPLAMIGAAAGQVFQQQAAQAQQEGRPIRPLMRALWRANRPWLLTLAAACLTAPWTFAWLFGERWREGGVIALVLLPWMAASLVVAPLSGLPLVLGRQRGALAWGLAYHLAMLGPLALAWAAGLTFRAALLLHALVAAALLVAYAGWLWRIAGDGDDGKASHG